MKKKQDVQNLSIKEARKVVRISPEFFSQCRVFSSTEEKKEYISGKGIVHLIIETIVYFECLHVATPHVMGGSCWRGTVVCKDCLVYCAEPGCSNMVCKSRTCDCGRVKEDGKLYCSGHCKAPGLLSLLFGG